MSLLGTQVYANPDTPCWLSSGGGAIAGNVSANQVFARKYNAVDVAGVTHGELTLNGTATGSVLTGDSNITFAKTGAITGNTTLTLSTAGANLDNLTVGGFIQGIGPSPTGLILTPGNTQTVPLNTTVTFTPSPAYPIIGNGIYEVQMTGVWTIGAGAITPDPEDYAQMLISVEPGSFPSAYVSSAVHYSYPADVNNPWKQNTFQPFSIRQRVVNSGVGVANVSITADLVSPLAATYPTIDVTIQYVSITRVA